MKTTTLAMCALGILTYAIPALAADRKPVMDAQAQQTKDEKALKDLKAKLQLTFTTSDEFKAAQEAVRQAEENYAAAVKPVMDALVSTPEFKAASEKADKAKDQLESLRKSGSTDNTLIMPAVEASAAATGQLSQMRNKALSDSPEVKDADAKRQAAREALKQLLVKHEASLKDDPDVAAAQKLVDDDKTKVADATKQYQQQADSERKTSVSSRPPATPRSTPSRSSGTNGRGY